MGTAQCAHARPGARFDPALTEGACPVCGSTVGAEKGQPVALHQKPGSRETCSGSGAPAQ